MSIVLVGSTSGSITLQEPAVAGSTVLDLPATSGTVAINGPAFSAYASTAQSISSSTYTKVTFDTEEFDTNNNFASSRFTPTIAGYYQISGGIQTSSTTGSQLVIYKNGSAHKYGVQTGAISFVTNNMSALVYFNGTTDYVELYALFGSTSNTTSGLASTYFQGVLVRAA